LRKAKSAEAGLKATSGFTKKHGQRNGTTNNFTGGTDMKRLLLAALLLTGIILLAACTAEPEFVPTPRERQERPQEEELHIEPEPEPEPEPKPEPEIEEEPASPFISVEEAWQIVKDTLDPNDEFSFGFHNNWSTEIDDVHYYVFNVYSAPQNRYDRAFYYIDKLTGEVYREINGRLNTLPLDELTEAILFVQSFNSMVIFDIHVPAFNHINEIPLENILKMFERRFNSEAADFQYTEEQLGRFGEFDNPHVRAYGIYPNTIESFISHRYSPDFKIGHYDFNILNTYQSGWHGKPGLWLSYDYNAVWDTETDAVVFIYTYGGGGGFGYSSMALKTEQDGDTFRIITVDYWSNHAGPSHVAGYYLQTVQRNENGDFNILSKQPVDINEASFTEEELNEINKFWLSEEIIRENKFVITQSEAKEIIIKTIDNIVFDDEIDWGSPELIDGYYSSHIWYGEYNFIGIVTINAITGEAHFEAYEE
jgi:hypothetical protein